MGVEEAAVLAADWFGSAEAATAATAATETASAAITTADAVYAGSSAASIASAAPSFLQTAGQAAATAVGSGVVQRMLTPKPTAPTVKPVVEMPDPLAQEAARKQSLLEQLARRGRQSTILTNDAGTSGTLGG